MPLPQATTTFYRTLQQMQVALVLAGRRSWSRMGQNFDQSWLNVAPTLLQVTAAAQLATARAASAYVPAALVEQGEDIAPEATVVPSAFAGIAPDGRSLAGLLGGAVQYSKIGMARGLDGGDALALGQRWLDQTLHTILSEVAREVTATEIAARPHVYWVRVVNPPCCSRCAVLAADVQYWNKPMPRHPSCDCLVQPATAKTAREHITNPQTLVDRGLITDLTKAQRQRLDDGADLVKVLNESRDRWRQRMTLQRREARYASYTDAERRAADRRAARRATNGLVVPEGWGRGTATPLPPGGVQDFLSHLTNRVQALEELRVGGVVR